MALHLSLNGQTPMWPTKKKNKLNKFTKKVNIFTYWFFYLLLCINVVKNEKTSGPDVCFAASALNRLHSTISFTSLILVCLTPALQFAFRFPFFISLLFLHFQEPFSFFLWFLLLLFNMREWNGQHWWLIITFWGGKQNRLILFVWWSVLYIFICCLNSLLNL